MNAREKALAGLTAAAVVFYGAWKLGLENLYNSFSDDSGLVLSHEESFQANLQALANQEAIIASFGRVGIQKTADNKLRPSLAFQQEVSEICKQHGLGVPSIKATVEEIEGVADYELISVPLRTEGSYDQAVKLLKKFQQSGMMFREMEIKTAIDSDKVELRVILARIAEVQKRRSTLRGGSK